MLALAIYSVGVFGNGSHAPEETRELAREDVLEHPHLGVVVDVQPEVCIWPLQLDAGGRVLGKSLDHGGKLVTRLSTVRLMS